MEHCGIKLIKTRRLILRQFKEEDSFQMFKNWANDNEVTRYLTRETHKNLEVTKEIINIWVSSYPNLDFYQWVVTYQNTPIGSISIMNINDVLETAEVGYCFSKKFRNNGFATESLNAIIDFCFNEIKLKKLIGRFDSENIGSGKVMAKCGLKYLDTTYDFIKNKQRKIIRFYINNNF